MQTASPPLELKDIHLPDAVSLWPPAIGYWLVLGLVIVCIIMFISIKKLRQRRQVKRLALTKLNKIKKQFKIDHDEKKLVSAVSELLRRAAISSYPRSDCASLTGNDWLKWLDQPLSKDKLNFTDGSGYLLTEFIYSKSAKADDINQLLSVSQRWLKTLPAVNSATQQTQEAQAS